MTHQGLHGPDGPFNAAAERTELKVERERMVLVVVVVVVVVVGRRGQTSFKDLSC